MNNKISKISKQILISSKIFKKSLLEIDIFQMYKSIESMKSLHGKLIKLHYDLLEKKTNNLNYYINLSSLQILVNNTTRELLKAIKENLHLIRMS